MTAPYSGEDEPAEDRRLAALHAYGMLDTPRESDFDEIARIAADVCETPIALVSLVDANRQFFKAEVGLGVRETPLETSFCGHAILAEDMMIVPDALEDPRFRHNPLVTGAPGLRFYAGILLKTADGLPIGTLCVLDHVPRTLGEDQIRMLKFLARQAMAQLDLRRALSDQARALEAARAEQQRRADLVREMTHRMKNTLALAQSIVRQSFRTATSLDACQEAIAGRLIALGSAQGALTEISGPANVAEVVPAALAAHRTGEGRFAWSGPAIQLGSPQVLGLSLAIHELATNAVKYGALSEDTGRVGIVWSEPGPGRFRFEWTESGGPVVSAPTHRGFGSRLMERIVAPYFDGGAELSFAPEGVRYVLEGFQMQSEEPG